MPSPLPEDLMASVNQLANEASNIAFDMFEDDAENDLLVKSTLEAEQSMSQQHR